MFHEVVFVPGTSWIVLPYNFAIHLLPEGRSFPAQIIVKVIVASVERQKNSRKHWENSAQARVSQAFIDLRQHSRLFLVETWSCTFKTHGKEADRIPSDSRKNGRDTL
jgi:hypothetical protein